MPSITADDLQFIAKMWDAELIDRLKFVVETISSASTIPRGSISWSEAA